MNFIDIKNDITAFGYVVSASSKFYSLFISPFRLYVIYVPDNIKYIEFSENMNNYDVDFEYAETPEHDLALELFRYIKGQK